MTNHFKLTSPSGEVEVGWTHDGDFLVWIAVDLDGMFRDFVRSVRTLCETRQGEAGFVSVYDGEFELKIQSIGNLGHLGVCGHLKSPASSDGEHSQRLEFSMGFSPEQIEKVVRALSSIRVNGEAP